MYKRNYPAKIDGAHEFTVIFIPGETFYQAALEHDTELLDYAFGKSIILASPNTLVAILKAAAMGWRETRLAAEAKTIRDEGEKIYKALRSVAEHLGKLGDGLEKATMAYNNVIGSVETRLLPPARKMNELGIREAKDMPALALIETSVRTIVRPDLVLEVVPAQAELQVAATPA
jgi:DNA recombination protein RmuC